MYQIPAPEFDRRLRHWRTLPDRRHVLPRIGVEEWWALGVCRLRRVDLGGGYCALYGHKGVAGYPPGQDEGKVSFGTWDDPERVFGDGKPHGMPMVPRR